MTTTFEGLRALHLWGPADVAAFLNISRRHLDDRRAEDPTFPAPLYLGRLPRWRPEVVLAWVEQQCMPQTRVVAAPRPLRGVQRVR